MIAVARAQRPFMSLEDVTMQTLEDMSNGKTQPWRRQEEEKEEDEDEDEEDDERSRTGTSQRGYSDSVLSCRLPVQNMHRPSFSGHVSASPPLAGNNNDDKANEVAMRQPTNEIRTARRVKTRHVLRLPPFQSLGLCGPLPGSLPTPPDEITQSDFPIPAVLPEETGAKMSFPDGKNLPTPDPMDAMPSGVGSISEAQSPTAGGMVASSTVEQGASGPSGTSVNTLEAADPDTDIPAFLWTPINIATRNIPTESVTSHHTISIMAHTQPCPLPQEDGVQETAYEPLIGQLRSMLGSNTFFDVTIAVPANFESSRVLTSPTGTPNTAATASDPDDYFTYNNNVFPRVVLSPEHPMAMTIAGPPSPRTAVPPSSIQISILERYLPPPTLPEYTDLFGLEGPSVLVDRLFELSPRNGTLIFVYPTARGATQFSARCLHPVIDPLLRTLISVHDLSNDLGPSVTRMLTAPLDANSSRGGLMDFDRLQAKIAALLTRLNRPARPTATAAAPATTTTASHRAPTTRPTPTFTLAHATAHSVVLDPATWIPWWLQQQKARIENVVDRYYQRGHRVPNESVLSSRSLAWKIMNGLKDLAHPRDELAVGGGLPQGAVEDRGIEVGVFAVVRSS